MSKPLLYIFFALIICIHTNAQPPANIFFRKLTQQQGLSKNSIWSTYRDRAGFLWIASSKGLNRYDGAGVLVYEHSSDTNSIPVNAVRYMTEDSQGKLWMSSESDIFFFDRRKNKFRLIDISAYKKKVSRISHLIYASDGNIYAGQGNYLLSINANTLKTSMITIDNDSAHQKYYGIYHFTEDKNGLIWFSNYPYLCSYDPKTNRTRKYNVLPERPNNSEAVEAGSITDDGDFLWLGMYSSGGLARFNKTTGAIQYFTVPQQEFAYAVTATATDKVYPDFLWVGMKTLGLGLFDKRTLQFRHFYTRDDSRTGSIISNNITASIEFDQDNTCWVSTSDGLCYFNLRNQPLQTVYIEPYDGKSFNRYQYEYILKDKFNPQQFIISTKDNGIVKYDIESSKVIYALNKSIKDPETRYRQGFIDWLYNDQNGKTWLSNLDGVFTLSATGASTKILDIKQFDNHSASRLQVYEGVEDHLGNMWFASSTGLWKYEMATKKFSADSSNALLKEDMFYIRTDNQHNLWLIMNKHIVVRYEPASGKIRQWKIFADSGNKSEVVPLRMVIDRFGNPWVSSVEGLIHIDVKSNAIAIIREKDGLCSSSLLQLAYDGNNTVYAGSEGCVSEINIMSKLVKNYGLNEGLLDNSVRGGLLYDNEKLWIGGRNYLQVMSANTINYKKIAPLYITEVLANDKKIILDTTETMRLGYWQNSLQIDYRLLDLFNESNYEYEYRLLHFTDEWVKAGVINKAIFFNLPSGKYRFEVRAINRKSGTVAATTHLDIIISTPWWETWWFRVGVVAILCIVAYYLYNLRISKLLAVERTRQRIGKDLHDDIGTALSSITLMNAVIKKKIGSNPEDAMRLANKVEDTSRQMIQNMSDIVWNINPGNDTMEKLFNRLQQFMNDAFNDSETKYQLDISDDLYNRKINMEARKDAYLISKEIISNASKYSQATHFNMKISTKDNFLAIDATDDGRGFEKNSERTGNGMNNIQLRTQKHKGTAVCSTEKGNGTKWEVKLKL